MFAAEVLCHLCACRRVSKAQCSYHQLKSHVRSILGEKGEAICDEGVLHDKVQQEIDGTTSPNK